MKPLFRIYNKNYWASVFGPIITFFAPVAIIILMCEVYTFSNNSKIVTLSTSVIPSMVYLCPYIMMILILPQAIFEIKESILVKQLKASSIKTWQILFVGVCYYLVTAVIAYFVSVLAFFIFANMVKNQNAEALLSFNENNWATMIYVLFINLLVGCSIGMALGSICTKNGVVSLIAVLLIFLSVALAGFLAPILLAPTQHKGLWILSYFDILRYPVMSNYEAWYSRPGSFNIYGSSLFDFSTKYSAFVSSLVSVPFDVFKPIDKILNLVMPYLTFITATVLSVRFFRT